MTTAEKLVEIAENLPRVYEAGKNSQNKAFWDNYLRDSIPGLYAFAGYGWTDDNFLPTRDIVVSAESAERMFYVSRIQNLQECLKAHGVRLDLSKATNASGMFYLANTSTIPEINISSATNLANCFNSSNIKRIERVTLPSNASNSASAFAGCSALEYIRIGGTIELSGLDLHWSTKLDADSIASIIEALSDIASGLSITLPSTSRANYLEKYSENDWSALLNTKLNWSIGFN